MKKLVAGMLCFCMLAGVVTACTKESGNSSGKKTINLWTFTDEVPNMVNKFMELHPDFAEQYEVVPTIIATTNGSYQPALDAALKNGEVDMYAAEAAFVLKYTKGDASAYAAAYKDLGIDVDKEILIYLFLLINPFCILGDLFRKNLNHISIKVDTLVENRSKETVAVGIALGIDLKTSLKLSKTTKRDIPESSKAIIHQSERHCLHHILLRPRSEEVGICKNRLISLEIAGRTLNFLRLSP